MSVFQQTVKLLIDNMCTDHHYELILFSETRWGGAAVLKETDMKWFLMYGISKRGKIVSERKASGICMLNLEKSNLERTATIKRKSKEILPTTNQWNRNHTIVTNNKASRVPSTCTNRTSNFIWWSKNEVSQVITNKTAKGAPWHQSSSGSSN